MVDLSIFKKKYLEFISNSIKLKELIMLIRLLGFLFIFYGCTTNSNKTESTDGIPQFNFKILNSVNYFNTKDIVKGKPSVFLYFGPFCEASRNQMDNIIKNRMLFKDFMFYLISDGDEYDTNLFYKHYQLQAYSNIIVVTDPQNFFAKYYHLTGTPNLIVYGKDGRIRSVLRNFIFGRQLKEIAESRPEN